MARYLYIALHRQEYLIAFKLCINQLLLYCTSFLFLQTSLFINSTSLLFDLFEPCIVCCLPFCFRASVFCTFSDVVNYWFSFRLLYLSTRLLCCLISLSLALSVAFRFVLELLFFVLFRML